MPGTRRKREASRMLSVLEAVNVSSAEFGRGGSTIDRYACCQAGEAEHRESRRAKVTSGAEGNCVRGAVLPPAREEAARWP